MPRPELQEWQAAALFLEEQGSAAAGDNATVEGARPPAAVSSVIQAWHPTGRLVFRLCI